MRAQVDRRGSRHRRRVAHSERQLGRVSHKRGPKVKLVLQQLHARHHALRAHRQPDRLGAQHLELQHRRQLARRPAHKAHLHLLHALRRDRCARRGHRQRVAVHDAERRVGGALVAHGAPQRLRHAARHDTAVERRLLESQRARRWDAAQLHGARAVAADHVDCDLCALHALQRAVEARRPAHSGLAAARRLDHARLWRDGERRVGRRQRVFHRELVAVVHKQLLVDVVLPAVGRKLKVQLLGRQRQRHRHHVGGHADAEQVARVDAQLQALVQAACLE
eukprot:364338-Chlamydomonas_euryale.AAC.3